MPVYTGRIPKSQPISSSLIQFLSKQKAILFLPHPSHPYRKMPILFIAVKCVQCSIMQVKQQKKSSNKWVCVVCNQRQSVLRIHARGFIACALRKFVQEFNISRMKQESGDCISFSQASDGYLIGSSLGGKPVTPSKKRTDWSEYLDSKEYDPDSGDGEDLDSDTLFGGDLMAEYPRKKLNRPSKKQLATAEKKTLNNFLRNGDLYYEGKGSSSKWSEYMDEKEENEDSMASREDSLSDLLPFGTCSRVEDEVHPDFM